MNRVVIIGAGFGGLAAAAELAKAGFDVTLLEAHIYPGGCAGTFFHRGFRFDAGATLAGGFNPGAPMDLIGKRFSLNWDVRPASRAMVVHLSNGSSVTRWNENARWVDERTAVFGEASSPFWEWQERTADALWDMALRLPAWPPQTFVDIVNVFGNGIRWFADNHSSIKLKNLPTILLDSLRPVQHHLNGYQKYFKQFVDAQLLIASQTTSERTNSLYGAVALDLPRQGVVEVSGGMGHLADELKEAVNRYGGEVHFRKEVTHISRRFDSTYLIRTKGNEEYQADILIFNLTPWNINLLTRGRTINKIKSLPPLPNDAWGAFTVYVGLKADIIPDDTAGHHQVIIGEPLGEGNSIFLSISPKWDSSRAPEGHRSITISTHTNLRKWWRLFETDQFQYEHRKHLYTEDILNNAERILPGLRASAKLILPGTPVTFRRFTRRTKGWVGGFPQTGLFRVWGPRLAKNVWMVGDTIFPGQSVPAVSMGGIRVAQAVIGESQDQRFYSLRRNRYSLADV